MSHSHLLPVVRWAAAAGVMLMLKQQQHDFLSSCSTSETSSETWDTDRLKNQGPGPRGSPAHRPPSGCIIHTWGWTPGAQGTHTHTHSLRHCSRLTGLFRSLLFFLKSLQKTSLSSSLPFSSSSSSLALFSKCFSQHFLFFFCKWFKADLRSASFACLLVDWGLRAWPVSSMRREPHCHCHMSQFLIFYSSVSDLHLKQMFPHTELWQWGLYFKTCDELF